MRARILAAILLLATACAALQLTFGFGGDHTECGVTQASTSARSTEH